jgi:glyoxylase-like metal-dependent hydrolase (beta-lactamase superfamily II)
MIETWTIGAIKITKIEEFVEVIDGSTMITQALPENVKKHQWLSPHYADVDGNLLFSVHAFVIEHGDTIIVVDTCLGNGKISSIPRWNKITSTFLDDFKLAGFEPSRVAFVLCTHLHEDHVGWNTIKKNGCWVPTFPNAKYLFSKIEWDYWSGSEYSECILKSSIEPLIENSLKHLVSPPYQLTDGVKIIPTPGHTPGHVSVELVSEGKKAFITGDIMHSPIQCSEPEWEGASDLVPKLATKTRLAFLKEHENRDILILGTHFPTPSAGKIRTNEKTWIFCPQKSLSTKNAAR